MKFNENSRVKIPAILHFVRLGYTYLSLKTQKWAETTNIFTDIFLENVARLNPTLNALEVKQCYNEVAISLENEDLGKAFYQKLIQTTGLRLIDFDDFSNNALHVVTELTYKNGDDEFRPDITLLVNGLPLVFIEVKVPNNKDGMRSENERMQKRFAQKRFRRFANISQIMVFSNNMEYDEQTIEPIDGAFYATSSYQKLIFNYFREEEDLDLAALLRPLTNEEEDFVLKDTNLQIIKQSPEFRTNKLPTTPTNRLATSLFSPKRFAFLLQYAIAYVEGEKNREKHIMRYPQLFATNAIAKKLDEGMKQGIIWHTQGSGKTALAYYNVRYLCDYFQAKKIIPKFYFIVDRIDLLVQAKREFTRRGLHVHTIDSREAFAKDIKSNVAIHNDSGQIEITVVNIQKFKDDKDVIQSHDYQLKVQRIYFLDEVHRSYNPKGSFLANLKESDVNAIKIGLTGTPLLGDDVNSRALFGDYIHKYYYNASIKDGNTLRLLREEIATNYKLILAEALEQIKVLQGDADRKQVYSHHSFVEPMLDYIVKDFEQMRMGSADNSIGGMVVCDSSEQARMLFEIFEVKYAEKNADATPLPALSFQQQKKEQYSVKSAALILHDASSKSEQVKQIEDFKNGKIDFLFVYNMLLTGFDAPRLKKLYLGRVLKAHNLLQALTRVNRRYNNFRYGYVVDFANIQAEFDKTNKAYFEELQSELGDEIQHYSAIFKSPEEISSEIEEIKSVLLYYNIENKELFSQDLQLVQDVEQVREITKVLDNAKSLYNLIRLSGNYDLLDKLDFSQLLVLSREAQRHLDQLNMKAALELDGSTANLLNIALEDVVFAFQKIGESELLLAENLKDSLRRTREILGSSSDEKDPNFISLKEELSRLFKAKHLFEVSKEAMEGNLRALGSIHAKAKEIERKNNLLKAKYANDAKYMRLHKRLSEKSQLTDSEMKLFELLKALKQDIDSHIDGNSQLLENENYVRHEFMRFVIQQAEAQKISINYDTAKQVSDLLAAEYLNEYSERRA